MLTVGAGAAPPHRLLPDHPNGKKGADVSVPRASADRTVAAVLPPVDVVDALAPVALVDFATHAAALHARAMARLTLLRPPSTPAVPAADSLTARQVAQLLNADRGWVYRHQKQLGGIKLDGIVRFPRRQLDAYIARQQRLTQPTT